MTDLPNGDPMEPSPTATDVHRMIRTQNIRFVIGMILLLALVGFTAWLAGGGRAAARDNVQATEASLATNGRNDCVATRRNIQADALGRLTIAANNAEAAGLIDRDPVRVREERTRYDAAVQDWTAATASLTAEVLNRAPPEGCGPPIVTRADLPDGG